MLCRTLLLTLFALVPGIAWGASVYVEPGLDTIHDAVAQANPGDRLKLLPGIHRVSHTVLIDKNLEIRGDSVEKHDVHIVAIDAEQFNFEPATFSHPLDQGHIFFVTAGATKVKFRNVTIKNAPKTDIHPFFCEEEPPFGFGLNHAECFGDAIHSDGASEISVTNVEVSLNAGNGIWVDGAAKADFHKIVAVNNGAFGIDVDTALQVEIGNSEFISNQVSGVEASGHVEGTHRSDYVATIEFKNVLAKGNGEIGLEVERFQEASLRDATCADNREDGFDADRVDTVVLDQVALLRNLDDGLEMFPAGDGVPPDEQPADFPGSIIEILGQLTFYGNVGDDIERPPTED